MRRGLALGLLLGWLLGIGTGLLGVALTGGWYEYRLIDPGPDRIQVWSLDQVTMINRDGWHIVPAQDNRFYLRRPRFRLP